VTGPRAVRLRPFAPDSAAEIAWAEDLVARLIGGRRQVVRGEPYDALALPGFVAELDGQPAGIATWRPLGHALELAILAATVSGAGIGGALVEAVRTHAGRRPVRVVTTNDNLEALRFYQRLGFRLVELRPGAVDEARRTLKPEIAPVGESGIPIRDELELELTPDG
jgi:ribosomal protein S18 acetylase RimI-like enzyme